MLRPPLALVEPPGHENVLAFGERRCGASRFAEGDDVDEECALAVPPADGESEGGHPVARTGLALLGPPGEPAGDFHLVEDARPRMALLAESKHPVERVGWDDESPAEPFRPQLPGPDALISLRPRDAEQAGGLPDGVCEPIVHGPPPIFGPNKGSKSMLLPNIGRYKGMLCEGRWFSASVVLGPALGLGGLPLARPLAVQDTGVHETGAWLALRLTHAGRRGPTLPRAGASTSNGPVRPVSAGGPLAPGALTNPLGRAAPVKVAVAIESGLRAFLEGDPEPGPARASAPRLEHKGS